MNLDDAFADHAEKETRLAAAIEEFNAEQAAGRLGLDAYQRMKSLNEELIALGTAIGTKMDQVLASL